MKRACPDIVSICAEQPFKALLQLVCGFIRKGYCKNLPRSCVIDRKQILNIKQKVGFALKIALHIFDIARRRLKVHLSACPCLAVFYNVCNAVDYDGRFSAACAGKNEKRPLGMKNGLFLHLIHGRKVLFDNFFPQFKEFLRRH